MSAKTYEAIKPLENEKRGTLRGHQKGHSAANLPFAIPFPRTENPDTIDRTPTREAKSSVNYWKSRVRSRTLKDGTLTAELYVRMKEGGRDAWFNLATANRGDAARAARDKWLEVQGKGLAAVLAESRPEIRPARVCTVSEYIAAAKALCTARPQTIAEYEASLRRVIASVRGIKAKSDKHAHRAEWHAQIDAVHLDQITPADVKAWVKREEDTAAKKGQVNKDRRAHTIASHIRDARALFAEHIVAEVKKDLVFPPELPFAGVTATATTRRFECDVDPTKLYAAAFKLDPDTRTAFDLLLCGGLRRGEADLLPWAHVNLKVGAVAVNVTEFFRPKSKESYRTIPLPPDVVKRLRARRASAPAAEFVLEGRAPKLAVGRGYEYRARAWETLPAWLRKQGIRDRTPLHTLRKLSGSFIYRVAGLEAARRHLGHRDITTTAASYLAGASAVVNLAASVAGLKGKEGRK